MAIHQDLQLPSIGRIVHYVLEGGPKAGEHRPAIIVKVWEDPPRPTSACQLQVFMDGDGTPSMNDGAPNVVWLTSRLQGTGPGTWHWPEYVAPNFAVPPAGERG